MSLCKCNRACGRAVCGPRSRDTPCRVGNRRRAVSPVRAAGQNPAATVREREAGGGEGERGKGKWPAAREIRSVGDNPDGQYSLARRTVHTDHGTAAGTGQQRCGPGRPPGRTAHHLPRCACAAPAQCAAAHPAPLGRSCRRCGAASLSSAQRAPGVGVDCECGISLSATANGGHPCRPHPQSPPNNTPKTTNTPRAGLVAGAATAAVVRGEVLGINTYEMALPIIQVGRQVGCIAGRRHAARPTTFFQHTPSLTLSLPPSYSGLPFKARGS